MQNWDSNGVIIFFIYELTHYQSLHLIYLAALLKTTGFKVYVAHCLDRSNICELKTIKITALQYVIIVSDP